MATQQAYLEVASRLEELILDGTLAVGTRLPGERELCTRFGVSRPVLREALLILQERGLIFVSRNRGSFVAPANFDAVSRSLLLFSHRSVASVRDVVELRRFIEVPTAGLAAQRRRPANLMKLQNLLDDMLAHLPRLEASLAADPGVHAQSEVVDQHIQLDIGFHSAIAEAAQNPLVLPVLQSSAKLLSRYMYLDLRRSGGKVLAVGFHQRIFDCIREHDPKGAEEAMKQHLDWYPVDTAATGLG